METRYFIKKGGNKKHGIIHFLFTLERKLRISTKKKIRTSEWGKGLPKQINSTSELRKTLSKWKNNLDDFIEEKIRVEQRKPTKIEIQGECNRLISGITHADNDISIQKLIDQMLEEQKIELNSNTIRYKKIHFKHFIQIIGKQRTLYDLNEELLFKYRRVLVSEPRENTTINCYIKTIKSFLNWLLEKKKIKRQLTSCLKKLKEVKKDVIALLENEIEVLENSKLETHLQNQVDIFLFGCYTALSISDIKRVNREMIVDNYMKIRREKTGTILNIPIIPEALEILKKHNYQLPCISDNKGNQNLKQAFKILGLNRIVRKSKKYNTHKTEDSFVPLYQEISWHKSRKTAITTAIKKGIPHEYVMALVGHKKHGTLMKYIDVTKEDLKREMNKLSKTKNESTVDLSTPIMNQF